MHLLNIYARTLQESTQASFEYLCTQLVPVHEPFNPRKYGTVPNESATCIWTSSTFLTLAQDLALKQATTAKAFLNSSQCIQETQANGSYRLMETRWWPDKQMRGPWCPDTLWAALLGPWRVILPVFQVSIKIYPFELCCGFMTFWGGSGSGSANPCLWLMDPDPGSGYCYFRHSPSRYQQNTNF